MESIKSIEEFKRFVQDNQELLYCNAINADDIAPDDEWMQDNKWDDIYQKEVVNNGKI